MRANPSTRRIEVAAAPDPASKPRLKTRTGLSGQPAPQPSAATVARAIDAHPAERDVKPDANAATALALLKTEAAIREAETVPALQHVLANEIRKAVRANQVLVVVLPSPPARRAATVTAVSSLPTVDRNAPLIQGVEAGLGQMQRSKRLGEPVAFDLNALSNVAGTRSARIGDYPFQFFLWVPLSRSGKPAFAGLLLARDEAWGDYDIVIAKRLAETGAHAWAALRPSVGRRRRWASPRTVLTGVTLALALLMAVPVPMAVLAPFQIVPRGAAVVAAPIDGVIASVDAAPNKSVARGAVLLRYADTELRNALALAEQQLRVAEARLMRASQLAFESVDGRRDLVIAQAELEVRRAERDYAAELLARSIVRAPRSGLAVFNDAKDMIGRPVKTGERLMDVANPENVQARLEVPVADGYILAVGSDVRLFLDSEPMTPRTGRIVQADYRAEAHAADRVAFRAFAKLDEQSGSPPRLGIRGTAQVYGDPVPLGLFLFRRPIAKARQWLGL